MDELTFTLKEGSVDASRLTVGVSVVKDCSASSSSDEDEDDTKTDIMSRVNAALPIDTMLNGFQVAKTQMLAMSDQDESDCKQRPQYIEIQSGTCASHAGYGLITSSEECAAAQDDATIGTNAAFQRVFKNPFVGGRIP